MLILVTVGLTKSDGTAYQQFTFAIILADSRGDFQSPEALLFSVPSDFVNPAVTSISISRCEKIILPAEVIVGM